MTPEQRRLLFTVVKHKPNEIVEIGFTLAEARREHRTSKKVYVTHTLHHVIGEYDVVDWPDVILCRFVCEEGASAPAREAWLCNEERLEAIIEQTDAARGKVEKGELTLGQVVEREKRAMALMDAVRVVAKGI